jgi:molybdopterin-guanine dinucleotide biosynthesis protein B
VPGPRRGGCRLVVIAGSGSGVGKTLLGERLVAELARRGLRVAAVKHVHHGVDYRVKDTGRYMAAGAVRVVAVGPGEYMVVERGVLGFWDAVRLACRGSDAVVVEGFREHLEEALARGACGVYVGGPGEAPPGALAAEPGQALEALPRILELLLAGSHCSVEP